MPAPLRHAARLACATIKMSAQHLPRSFAKDAKALTLRPLSGHCERGCVCGLPGPVAIDPETRDIVQTVYIRRVERVDGRLHNVEIDRIENVKDPVKERMKK